MKPLPPPLTWPQVVTLEAARSQSDHALLALDLAFQRNAAAEEVTTALHAAARASQQEYSARQDVPSGN